MPEKVAFRTKPQLARRMLERALESGVPFGWVTGDEVYGNDRNLRLWLERRDVPHVLAVRSNEKLWAETDRGWRQVRGGPAGAWGGGTRLGAAQRGATAPRDPGYTIGARVEIRPLREPGKGYWLLVRRSIAKPGELAYYVCFGPVDTTVDTTLEELVAGGRKLVGPSKNALRRPRERWVWTSMKSGNGMAGTGTSTLGDAGPRLPGGGQAPGVGTRRSGRKGGCPSLDEKLIPLTVPEVRRFALPADMETSTYGRNQCCGGPRWRRRHQATARRCHYRRRLKTPHHISATVVLTPRPFPLSTTTISCLTHLNPDGGSSMRSAHHDFGIGSYSFPVPYSRSTTSA